MLIYHFSFRNRSQLEEKILHDTSASTTDLMLPYRYSPNYYMLFLDNIILILVDL